MRKLDIVPFKNPFNENIPEKNNEKINVVFKDANIPIEKNVLLNFDSEFINQQIENHEENIYIPLFNEKDFRYDNLELLDYLQSSKLAEMEIYTFLKN